MKSTDAVRFAEALIAVGEMYDKPVSNSLARLYFDDLADYDIEHVLSAMSAHRKDADRGRFFPKVADLIHQMKSVPRVTRETSMHPAWIAERNEASDRRLSGPKGVTALVEKIGRKA